MFQLLFIVTSASAYGRRARTHVVIFIDFPNNRPRSFLSWIQRKFAHPYERAAIKTETLLQVVASRRIDELSVSLESVGILA